MNNPFMVVMHILIPCELSIWKIYFFCGKPFEKVFCSLRTEATDAALKLMRMNGRVGKRRSGIICIENNWHGRTLEHR